MSSQLQGNYGFWGRALHYGVIYGLLFPRYHNQYRFEVLGRENLERTKGSFILVSNHFSYEDPTILSLALGRPIAYIAKAELFADPSLAWKIEALGAIPINREKVGSSTIKQVKVALGAGWPVGVFIEGTRNPSREYLGALQQGAAFLARLAGGVSVLPVGIYGGETKGDLLRVSIGGLISYDSSKSLGEMTALYGEAVAQLAGLKQQG